MKIGAVSQASLGHNMRLCLKNKLSKRAGVGVGFLMCYRVESTHRLVVSGRQLSLLSSSLQAPGPLGPLHGHPPWLPPAPLS